MSQQNGPQNIFSCHFFNIPETIFCACDNNSVSRSVYVSPWFSSEKKTFQNDAHLSVGYEGFGK